MIWDFLTLNYSWFYLNSCYLYKKSILSKNHYFFCSTFTFYWWVPCDMNILTPWWRFCWLLKWFYLNHVVFLFSRSFFLLQHPDSSSLASYFVILENEAHHSQEFPSNLLWIKISITFLAQDSELHLCMTSLLHSIVFQTTICIMYLFFIIYSLLNLKIFIYWYGFSESIYLMFWMF